MRAALKGRSASHPFDHSAHRRPDNSHLRSTYVFRARSDCVTVSDSGPLSRTWEGMGVAKEMVTRLVDDLDGGEAHETVTFGLDGHIYEIDLSTRNAKKLRSDLAAYVDKATRVAGRTASVTRSTTRTRGTAATERQQNQAIRDWAVRKGLAVAARGRIKREIVEQFHKTAGR